MPRAGKSEPLETRISGWKGACSRWNLLSLSVLICRMGGTIRRVSHWGVLSRTMMAVRAHPKLRQQTSQGWLLAISKLGTVGRAPEEGAWPGSSVIPQGFPKSVAVLLVGLAKPLLCHAGQAVRTLGTRLLPFPPGSSEPWVELLGTPFPTSRSAPTQPSSGAVILSSWPLLSASHQEMTQRRLSMISGRLLSSSPGGSEEGSLYPSPHVPTGGPSLHCGALEKPSCPSTLSWDHSITLADRGGCSALPWGCG